MESTKSYAFTPANVQYHYQTVPERMELQAKRLGEKEVYVFLHPDGKRETVTAAKMYELCMSLARSLVSLGVQKGDVVAMSLANDLDCLVSILSVICAGAVPQGVIVKNTDGSDVRTILNKSGAVGLILRPGNERKELNACLNFIDKIQENGHITSKSVPGLRYMILTESVEDMDSFLLNDLLQQEIQCELPMTDPEDTAVLLTTSGSTGTPKLVPHSHHSVMITGHHLKASMKYDADSDILYTERRLTWIGGFPFMYLHDGVKVVTKTTPLSSFTEHCKFTYDAIIAEQCTIACLLPATVVGLVECAKEPYYLLKNIHVGGHPVSGACMDTIGKVTKMVTPVYGSSEMGYCSSDHITDKRDFVNHSSGFPHAGVEIKVIGLDGRVVRRGEIGTIYVRSPCFFRQYFKDEKATKEVITPTHWMNTDDVGYINDVGRVIVTGRCSDVIMQGGKNFIPSTVEMFIGNHPDVQDVIVVSVPDDVKFVLVAACVVPKAGRDLSSADLFAYFKSKLLPSASEAVSFIYPELVFIFDDIPKLYTGKPDKKKVREEAIRRAKQMKA